MIRIGVIVMALAISCAAAVPLEAEFSNCYPRITPQADLSIITVTGRCTWKTFGIQNNDVKIHGDMTVGPSNQKSACVGQGYCGMSLKPPYIASTTYTSTARFEAFDWWGIRFDETTETDTVTTDDPIRPNTTCPDCCAYSPILISERGDYHLTSVADGVFFDLNADGQPERVSWTAPSSDLAFLARDRNRNGNIDDGKELFGDSSAANGWEMLAELDTNDDGIISSDDLGWRDLLLWSDRDHDGRSAPAELTPIALSGVVAIGTSYRWIGRRDSFGNMFRYAGEIMLAAGRRQAYDVYFLAY